MMFLRVAQIFAIFGTFVLADTARLVIASDFESNSFTGASGSCTSTGVYVVVNTTHMLFHPDSLQLRVLGDTADATNIKIVNGEMPACAPTMSPDGVLAIFNFTFADCPTEIQVESNTNITYGYEIQGIINARDNYQADSNVVFRENREFLSVSCNVESTANTDKAFAADIVSSTSNIDNATTVRIAARLYRDATFKNELVDPAPLSEWIYAVVGFDDGPSPLMYLTPHDCKAQTGDYAVHYLFRNGCPSDSKTQIFTSETVEASFKKYFFRFESFAFTKQIGAPIVITCSARSFSSQDDAKAALAQCPPEAYFDDGSANAIAKNPEPAPPPQKRQFGVLKIEQRGRL